MRKTIFILLSAAFLVGCNSTGANDGQANTYERATSEGDLERLEHRIKELEEDYISRLEEAEEKIKFSREMIDNISDNFSSTYQGYYDGRSEEHTSELQSRGHLVYRLLLEKKKKKEHILPDYINHSK